MYGIKGINLWQMLHSSSQHFYTDRSLNNSKILYSTDKSSSTYQHQCHIETLRFIIPFNMNAEYQIQQKQWITFAMLIYVVSAQLFNTNTMMHGPLKVIEISRQILLSTKKVEPGCSKLLNIFDQYKAQLWCVLFWES